MQRAQHCVYSAQNKIFGNVIVKVSNYKGLMQRIEAKKIFVNYLHDQNINVESYIEPGLALNVVKQMVITMTTFAKGERPESLPNNAFYLDKACVMA